MGEFSERISSRPWQEFLPQKTVGMILGPQLEASLRRSLIYSHGDLIIFFERPIAATLMALALLMLLSPIFRWVLGRKLLDVARSAPQGARGDKSNVASK